MSEIVFMYRSGIPRFYQVHQVTRDSEKRGVSALPIHTCCK